MARPRPCTLAVCLALAGVSLAAPSAAAGRRSIRATALAGGEAIALDGALAEPVWARAAVATDFVQQEPRPGERASERTEVRVAFDGRNLYFGVTCRIDPARIVTTDLARDYNVEDTDTIGILLDPFDDDRNGFMFVVTPDGALRDVQDMNDGANLNPDWNVVWDARTRRTDEGWTAEVVIPFKSLRFPAFAGQNWGINFNRKLRGRNEMAYWNPIPRPYGISRVSLAGELTGLEAPTPGRNLKVTPYVLGKALSRGGRADRDIQVGGDLKYGVGTTTTLDVTLNTDFSQTETDTRQVNLTRFPLYYPEQRSFFLENADLFHFGIRPNEKGGGATGEEYIGFFSRRVGLAADGTPLPIWGGARLTGRMGGSAFGLLQVTTRAQGATPATHFTVARGKRNLFGHSDAGVIVMNRQGAGSDHSRVVGGDVNLQFGRVNVTSFLVRSANPTERGRTHAGKLFAGYAGRRLDLFGTWIEVGDAYDRTLAYVPRRDLRMFRGEVNWHWRPAMPLVREWHPHVTERYILNSNSELRTKQQHFGLWVYFNDGSRAEIYQQRFFERLDRRFEITRGVVLPLEDYTFRSWVARLSSSQSRALAADVTAQWGGFWSGTLDKIDARVTMRVRPRFSLEGRYEHDRVQLRQGRFDTHLATLRLHHAFSTRQFLDLLVQYSSQDDVFSYQGRYNLIHRPLSDLFIVVNEQREYGVGQRTRSLAIKFNRLLDF